MQRIKKVLRVFKKHWITVWAIAAAVTLCSIYAYARFTDDKNYTKRVVAADTGNKTLFTSNYLTSSYFTQPITVPKDKTTASIFNFSVFNYDRTKPSTFYPTAITFSLNAKLKKAKSGGGLEDYSLPSDAATLTSIIGNDIIKIYKVEGNTKTEITDLRLSKDVVSSSKTQTLAPEEGQKKATNSYEVELPASLKDKDVYVTIEADPEGSHSDIEKIGAHIYLKSNNVNLTPGWTISINDQTTNTSPSQYDGFNFVIRGSGTETKTLSWDNTLIQPNKQQIKQLFNVTLTGNESSIQIALPSATDNSGQYIIQFYVVDENARKQIDGYTDNENTVHSAMTWNELSNKVTLT